jgi:hypothetical protein
MHNPGKFSDFFLFIKKVPKKRNPASPWETQTSPVPMIWGEPTVFFAVQTYRSGKLQPLQDIPT